MTDTARPVPHLRPGIWTSSSAEAAAIDLPLLHAITAAFGDLAVEGASVRIAGRLWTWEPMAVLTIVMPSEGAPHAFHEEPPE